MAKSPGDFGSRIAAETEKWAQLMRSVGIKPDEDRPAGHSANSGSAGNPTQRDANASVGKAN